MNDKTVDTLGKLIIAECLDGGRMKLPLLIVAGSEGLGADNFFAHDMRHRRHLAAFRLILISARGPELTHGLVGPRRVSRLIAKRQIVTFQGKAQAVLVREFGEASNIIPRK